MPSEAYAPGMSAVNPNLPTDFPLPSAVWAGFFGVTARTIRDWTDQYGIPYRQAGRDRLVKPSDLVAFLPLIEPPPQRE